jgi:hypothetical protein
MLLAGGFISSISVMIHMYGLLQMELAIWCAPVTDSKPQRKAPERISDKDKTDLINYMKLWAKENSQGYEDLKAAYGTKFPDFKEMEKPSFNIHVYFPFHAEFIQDFIKNYEWKWVQQKPRTSHSFQT